MNRDEIVRHWLLNLAIEFPIWVFNILPEVDEEGLNILQIPGCAPEDYAKGLSELFQQGLVTLTSGLPDDDVKSQLGVERTIGRFLKPASRETRNGTKPFTFVRSRIPEMQVQFQLTALGGSVWESLAEPNWMHAVVPSSDLQSADVMSPNRDLLMAYIGWYPQLNGDEVQIDSIEWQTCSDCKILYWKVLPLVHRASFKLRMGDGLKWLASPKWFEDWFVSLSRWYKEPWQLPIWPKQ